LKLRKKGTWQKRDDYLFFQTERSASPTILVTGMGMEAASSGLLAALSEWGRPSCLIGFGWAGGLIKNSQTGDLVLPVLVQSKKGKIAPTEWLRMNIASSAPSVEWRKLYTAENVVSTPPDKAALFAATGAEAVDLESYGWGEICQAQQIPWAVIRSVLDGGGELLPSDWIHLVDRFGRPKWSRAAAFFATHPKSVWKALQVSRKLSTKAGRVYAHTLSHWLETEREKKTESRRQPTIVSEISQFS